MRRNRVLSDALHVVGVKPSESMQRLSRRPGERLQWPLSIPWEEKSSTWFDRLHASSGLFECSFCQCKTFQEIITHYFSCHVSYSVLQGFHRPQFMTSLTFKLPANLCAAIEHAAASEGRTLSDFIRRNFAHLITRPAKKKGAKKP